jgi:ABC-type nitrate/sulfonate/bicarbonate transport system permease component
MTDPIRLAAGERSGKVLGTSAHGPVPSAADPAGATGDDGGVVSGTLASHTMQRWVLGCLGVIIVIGIWQLTTSFWLTSDAELAPPGQVIGNLIDQIQTSAFWGYVGETVSGWGVGLAISIVIGIPVGILVGSSTFIWHALRPTLEFLRPIPGIALMPLALILWGQSMKSDVFLIAFGTVWTMIIQAMYGVRSVDPVTLETGRVFGLSAAERIRFIVLPSSLPYLATGIRIASSVALVIAISAELLIGDPGLGNQIGLAQSYSQYDEMYALILATGLLGMILQILSVGLERHFLRWHQSQRGNA